MKSIYINDMEINTLLVDTINCWIVNLKPYDERYTTADTIYDFQQLCIKEKIFGIGWIDIDRAPKDGKKHYLANSNENWFTDNVSSEAKGNMENIKIGDLVIMRLRDGHIYIGKVKEPAFYKCGITDKNGEEPLSCMCEVEKWYEIKNEDDFPSAICGRLSQKHQSTIERISNCDQKLLMIFVYENFEDTEKIIDVPKIRITEDSFARTLNYMELEDLVCAYIYDKHKDDNYMILPSSCKISRRKYEFSFVSSIPGKKPITCQVKNQNDSPILISDYENDKEEYERIYLFSGNGNIAGNPNGNIKVIENKELYRELFAPNNNKMKYLKEKLEKYYSINNDNGDNTRHMMGEIIGEFYDKGYCVKRYTKNNQYKVWPVVTDEEKKCKEKVCEEKTWVEVPGGYFSENYDCFIVWDRDKFEKSIKAFGIEWKE